MKEMPQTIITAKLTESQKAKVQDAVNEAIDLFRKKHKLNIEETAFALDTMVEGFNNTVRDMK